MVARGAGVIAGVAGKAEVEELDGGAHGDAHLLGGDAGLAGVILRRVGERLGGFEHHLMEDVDGIALDAEDLGGEFLDEIREGRWVCWLDGGLHWPLPPDAASKLRGGFGDP